MISLTLSFSLAERYNNARRKAIQNPDVPSDRSINIANAVALWTFPTSMILLTIYAAVNIL
jgi:tRNA(Leu) C34 or U34 (ribose-2'-O)-methylase TrmL